MGKNKKTETIVAVLIPVLVFLLMAALTVVLWDAHNPSGARSAGASTETGTVQPGIAKEGEDLEAQTEKACRSNPHSGLSRREARKIQKQGDTGAKTQEETQNTQ